MAKLIRKTKYMLIYPVQIGYKTIALNGKLWNTMFWDAWYPLPLDQKLAWIAFVSQTMGILTLIELLLLKK